MNQHQIVENPKKLYVSERLEGKRAAVKLIFAGHLSHARNDSFRTSEISLPFNVLSDISGSKKVMARPAGLEPAASRLEVSRSIQMSYGRAPQISLAWIASKRNCDSMIQ
jgi:site-specific DNA recombinase